VDEADAIGRRVAHARKLRGLTQLGLAGRAHVSKSLIAQVESGHKPATPSLVAAVSAALNVDLTDLTGQPYRGSNARSDRIHTAIPQIRQALVYWDVAPILDVPPRPLGELAAETDRAGQLRMQASYVELGALLPALLLELTVHAYQARDAQRARAFRYLADAYTAVDSMAYKLGYMDLFAIAAERMAWAATQADDPLLRPVSAIRRSSAFLAAGAWYGGMRLLDRAGREIEDGLSDQPGALSVLGTVHLRTAIMAAREAAPARPGTRSAGPARSAIASAKRPAITGCCSARRTWPFMRSLSRSNSGMPMRPSAGTLTLYFRPGWPVSGPVTTTSICPARGCGSGTTPGPWPASPRQNNSLPSAPGITPWPVRR